MTVIAESTVAAAPATVSSHLPDLVGRYVARSVASAGPTVSTVRVHQRGDMRQRPGGKARPFRATEDFAVDRVAFSWRARFPIIGPLALTVVDEFADGSGLLRVSLLGVPLQTMQGPETNIGETMRYLSELVWAPHAIAANREISWREVDEQTVEVASIRDPTAAVQLEFDAAGDVVRATGVRPFPVGASFVSTPWGGDFGRYTSFGGTRVPAYGEAWWDLPQGRFVYWRGHIDGLDLIEEEVCDR